MDNNKGLKYYNDHFNKSIAINDSIASGRYYLSIFVKKHTFEYIFLGGRQKLQFFNRVSFLLQLGADVL